MLSSSGFKYLLTGVDDCTRYTWVFPLKLKSDIRTVLSHFITMVEVQFTTKLKGVRTDGEREFKAMASFFTTRGIAHRLVHTHHQNG